MANFEVKGLRELERKLRALPQAIARKGLRSGLLGGGKVIRDEARQRAPVATGKLRNQIIYYPARRGSHPYADQVRIGVRNRKRKGKPQQTDAYYWLFHEFGTSKMAARPFLRPALSAAAQRAFEVLKERTRVRLEKLVKEL